jgi:hypothetical protein
VASDDKQQKKRESCIDNAKTNDRMKGEKKGRRKVKAIFFLRRNLSRTGVRAGERARARW